MDAAFYGLCRCLFLSDQGLICSSICNTESMKNAPFQCFYLLQPSSKGTMLLRVTPLCGRMHMLTSVCLHVSFSLIRLLSLSFSSLSLPPPPPSSPLPHSSLFFILSLSSLSSPSPSLYVPHSLSPLYFTSACLLSPPPTPSLFTLCFTSL